MPNRTRSWTDEQLISAVNESYSIAAVLRCLGLPSGGYNSKYVKKHIVRLGLSTSHFKKRNGVVNTGSFKSNVTLDQLRSGKHAYTNVTHLKRRLIQVGLLDPSNCEQCGIAEWCGKPIVLQLDHIDGVRQNNILSNLRLLCPNCHSQTDTFCGKNRKLALSRKCKSCGIGIYSSRTYCDTCFNAGAQYNTRRMNNA